MTFFTHELLRVWALINCSISENTPTLFFSGELVISVGAIPKQALFTFSEFRDFLLIILMYTYVPEISFLLGVKYFIVNFIDILHLLFMINWLPHQNSALFLINGEFIKNISIKLIFLGNGAILIQMSHFPPSDWGIIFII